MIYAEVKKNDVKILSITDIPLESVTKSLIYMIQSQKFVTINFVLPSRLEDMFSLLCLEKHF